LSQYLITYAPSATVLTKIEKRKEEDEPPARLIAFGNPDFNAEEVTGESASRGIMQTFYKERGIHFDSLPFTLQEVENLKAIYKDATIYTGDDAREARAKNECPEYRFVHFATHGILDELEPMYSGVVLTLAGKQDEDGFLQAYEVYNLRLNTDLVVLSACQTGLGKIFKGEGVVGLSRAFMYAGTRSIAVSLWPVVDQSTALLMENFYEHLHDGKDKDEALRQAQLHLLNETEFALPAFWAPFVLIGDWQ
jgi:CHAT domain-containing protein